MGNGNDGLATIVRGFFGALGGVVVGLGWMWYLTPWDTALVNWIVLIVAVAICSVLAVKFGDEFWEKVFPHL